MDLNVMKSFIISSGGYLHHVGMLVEDTAKAIEELKRVPGFGEWTTNESTWDNHEMIVGRENTIICSTSRIMDSVLLEVIEPVKGKCDGTHFKNYLEQYGEGLHHLCYGFPHYADFEKVFKYFENTGYKDMIHGRKLSEDGNITDEYCYMEVLESELYIELSWTRYKWGY